ncbi:uncharacterized protein EDB93DRAFT_1102011 [Suillus bovinus]|uniref:uncharacterized protein n=1 Tax=Suillus bovinus TaxID=48563 RepID=UPI001B87354D|nr:uncharacterized protein EDB93DRAFT_1102011 [Suillus bovinus]KAG2155018.1 hypothetical protein EDB93DRAFT_1102011 [Suillus bovinus]
MTSILLLSRENKSKRGGLVRCVGMLGRDWTCIGLSESYHAYTAIDARRAEIHVEQFAYQDIIKHIATGGYWYNPNVKKWIHGGEQVISYLGKHPERAHLLGISSIICEPLLPGSGNTETSHERNRESTKSRGSQMERYSLRKDPWNYSLEYFLLLWQIACDEHRRTGWPGQSCHFPKIRKDVYWTYLRNSYIAGHRYNRGTSLIAALFIWTCITSFTFSTMSTTYG